MTRCRLVLGLFLGVVACSADSITGPEKGAVSFTVDAQSCRGSAAIDFFVDGARVGTETLAAGQTSRGYSVDAGSHVVGASVSNAAGFVWPSRTVAVPKNTTFNTVLTCG